MNSVASPDPSDTNSSAPAVTPEGETFASAPRRLRYVELPPPAPGTSVPIAPGVRWARIPLPMELSHINVWLVDTADGCVIVDTGIAAVNGKTAWETIERDVLRTRPVRAVLITHTHPDHIGLAAWLQERHRVPVLMSQATHRLARYLVCGEGSDTQPDPEQFFRMHGLVDTGQVGPVFKSERFARMTTGMPAVERFIQDNEVLDWSPGDWMAMQTDGHAEGHLCLWSGATGALISGDQILPTISTNVSFGLQGGDPDPLGSYLGSLQRLRALPADTLVLPSHGMPFYGLHERIEDLIAHHSEQLDAVCRLCAEPRTATQLLPFMFRRELKGLHVFLALGEALAHLEYLVHTGRLERRLSNGQMTYRVTGG